LKRGVWSAKCGMRRAPPTNHLHSSLCIPHSELKRPAGVTLPVQRLKRPLHHFNACRPENDARGRIRTCAGDALDVVSLLLDYASKEMEPPTGVAPARFLYKRNPQAAAWRRK